MQSARNSDGDENTQSQINSKKDHVHSTALPTLPPTMEGTVLPNDKFNELHDDGNITTDTPTNAENSFGLSTEAKANITPRPTRSPTAATDTVWVI